MSNEERYEVLNRDGEQVATATTLDGARLAARTIAHEDGEPMLHVHRMGARTALCSYWLVSPRSPVFGPGWTCTQGAMP